MIGLPSSPRIRRRLVWLAALAGAASVVGAIVALLPSSSPPAGPARANEGPAQLAVTVRAHLTAADRRSIDATLDRFVPAAVGRRSAATAWALAGPELKAASTLAEWRAGTSPVPSYPVKGTTFHDWTAIEVTRDTVSLNLLVHPRKGSKLGSYVFSGQLVRHGKSWLVNRWYTIAIMNPVRGSQHEIGPADFGAAAAPANSAGASSTSSALGHVWLIAAGGVLLGLLLLIPVGAAVRAAVHARRWRRRVSVEGRNELPPLPSAYRRRG